MQMLVSAGLIALVVVWGLLAPASLGAVFNEALAAITRNFGWFYLWVVLGLGGCWRWCWPSAAMAT